MTSPARPGASRSTSSIVVAEPPPKTSTPPRTAPEAVSCRGCESDPVERIVPVPGSNSSTDEVEAPALSRPPITSRFAGRETTVSPEIGAGSLFGAARAISRRGDFGALRDWLDPEPVTSIVPDPPLEPE